MFKHNKLILNQFLHYTEIVLPKLAEKLGLAVRFNTQFQAMIVNVVFDGKSTVPYYRLSRRELRKAVDICVDIVNNPQLIYTFCSWNAG